MTSKELNLLLIKTFPNLNNAYMQEVSWQEGNSTGSHTVYGDVLTPYVISCIENNNQKEIKEIFTYKGLFVNYFYFRKKSTSD
ncbi:hypothetical protein [Enterococcus sp. AZ196]|uniref:hypothetical protein n=1 Tax=Enterococcus sp. AZ196 TaxID=2774659 RepID=UPI003D2CCC7E